MAEKEKEQKRKVEKEREKQIREDHAHHHQPAPPNISPMEPITHDAYGGGLYGTDDDNQIQQQRRQHKPANKLPASETQSADGPDVSESGRSSSAIHLKHKPPPSSGDRDIDITDQSYFQ